MDVGSILRTAGGLLQPGNPKSEPSLGKIELASPVKPAAPIQDAALRGVMARYDVTNISPREFTNLLQDLQTAGAISNADVQEFGLLRLQLDQQGLDPDEPVNLLQFAQQQLHTQEHELSRLERKQPEGNAIGREDALRGALRQIDWLTKLSLLHAGRHDTSLDAIA